MKNRKYNYSVIALLTAIILVWSVSCTRDFDELELAKFPSTPEVFIDGFSAGLNYAAFGGSKVTAFDVDQDVKFSGSASMKIEVPDAGDPEGAYAGGVYFTTVGRDLSDYDALTFWAKASKSATIDLVGFGNDLGESEYLVSLQNVAVNSNWKKYIIPIPDASKLTEERGMFYYSEGPEDGLGYTFWVDEVKFEKLGTIAHKQPMILDGEDEVESAVNGLSFPVGGLSVSFNMPTGIDQAVIVAPAYFTFSSSNASVASVDAEGMVTVLSAGTAIITATSGGEEATGSLTVTSAGDFTHAPDPAVAPEDVISIFSNAYTNVPVDFYNGYWEPYQTTTSADFKVGNDDVLFYTNFNFVGIQFTSPTIDATEMTHLHMDVWIPNAVDQADKLSVKVVDMGPNGVLGGDPADDVSFTYEIAGPLASQSWISVDLDLSSLPVKSKLGQIILERIGTSLSGFYLDNVYLYDNGGGTVTAPTEAAPTPPARDAADVISIYGDAYTNLAGTDFPFWGQATVVSDVTIEGNTTLKFAGLNFQGVQFASSQDVTDMEFLHMDFWTANSTALSTFLISTGPVEIAYALTVPTSGWTSVDIPISSFSGVDLADVIQMKFDGNGDIYLDNIYFYKSGGTGGGPATAAPTPPTRDAADVISIYGEAYGAEVGLANVDWDNGSGFVEETIASNKLIKVDFVDFLGTQLNSVVDASAMTDFHMDVWIDDDFEAGQIFNPKWSNHAGGAGETNAFELTRAIGDTELRKWISIDVPIDDFTGDNTRANLAQFLLAVAGKIDVAYVDNIYFYKNGGGGTATEPTTAPTAPPTRDAADVISIYGEAYGTEVGLANVDWDNGSGFVEETIASNKLLKVDFVDFLGTQLNSVVDATAMTDFHMDVWIADDFEAGQIFNPKWSNHAGGAGETNAFELTRAIGDTELRKWISIDVPITDFTGDNTRANLAQFLLAVAAKIDVAYVDNIYFYKTSGGATCEDPTAAPTAPAEDPANVISVFSDAYTDIAGTNFNPSWGQSTVVTTESIGGGSTLKYDVFNFQGTNLGGADGVDQDLSSMEYLHIDMWTCDATVVQVTPISRTTGESLVSLTPISTGQWNSYDIPLSDFTGVSMADIYQLKFDGQAGTTPSKIFIDNVYFYKTGGGTCEDPIAAPPAPEEDAADVISVFSDAYTDIASTNFNPSWGQSTVVTTESIGGGSTLKYDVFNFQGTNLGGADGVDQDLSSMEYLHIDMWTCDATVVQVTPISRTTGESLVSLTPITTGQWNSYDIPLSDFTGVSMSDIFQLKFDGQAGVTPSKIFIDNIYFYTTGGGSGDTGPATSAPTPSLNSADVISIFSDAYTDVTVDKWSADWDAADVGDFTVGSDNLKKITFSPGNYAGIEFLTNKIDASGMTHFHMDIWTPDAIEAGNNFIIKFSDWTGGASETSFHELQVLHTASGDVPALETGTWVSIEVPLSVFSNPASPYTEVAQLVLTANGIGTLYFDNVYFHK